MSWNESKRLKNIQQHGIDFIDCHIIFDSFLISKEDDREPYGEQRIQSLGILRSQVVYMVWVDRLDEPHFISIRKATKHEQRFYYSNIQ